MKQRITIFLSEEQAKRMKVMALEHHQRMSDYVGQFVDEEYEEWMANRSKRNITL